MEIEHWEVKGEAIANLKAAMLTVQTLGEIHALIVDYTFEEIEQGYNQLTPEQQAKLKAICDRDIQRQLVQCGGNKATIQDP